MNKSVYLVNWRRSHYTEEWLWRLGRGYLFGAWLSLVERLVRDQEVRSSNLRAPTTFSITSNLLLVFHQHPSLLRPIDAISYLSKRPLVRWRQPGALGKDSQLYSLTGMIHMYLHFFLAYA